MTLPNGAEGLNENISLAFALSNDGSIPYRALLDRPTAEELLKERMKESSGWQSAHQAAFEGLLGDPNTPLITKIVWTIIKSLTNISGNIQKTIGNILNEIAENRVQFFEDVIPELSAGKITSGQFGQAMVENLVDKLAELTNTLEAARRLIELKSSTGANLVMDGDFRDSTLTRFPYGPNQIVDGYSILKAHSGLKSWTWTQLEATHCGFYFAPTQTVDSFLVMENDVYLMECWVYPSAQNYTPTGAFRMGCTLSDSTGQYGPVHLYQSFQIADVPIGQWNRLTHKVTIPDNTKYDTAKFYFYANNEVAAGSVYWLDDVILKEISAAQSAYDGVEELGDDVITAGPNLIVNSSFETGRFAQLAGTYSDEQAHSGTRSLKITAGNLTKKFTFLSTDGNDKVLPTTAGDVFYGEFWVYGKSTNSQTTGGAGAIKLVFDPLSKLGISLGEQAITVDAGPLLKGAWTKVSNRVTMPANTVRVKISLQVTNGVASNEVYYFDDVVVREITVAAAAEELAKLNDELTKALVESGSNLIVNGGFENGWFTQGAGTYSQDVARTGSRSLKIVASGLINKTYTFLSDDGNQRFIPASGGDWFNAEFYVYGKSTNTQTAPGIAGIKLIFEPFNNNTELDNQIVSQYTSIALSNMWTKVTGKVQMPANTTRVRISLMVTQEVTANDTYYFDDVSIKEITAAQQALEVADLNEDRVNTIIQSGYNLIVNPSFEKGWFAQGPATYSEEQFRTGTRSLKIVADGSSTKKFWFMSEDNNQNYIPASPGDIFYVEIWVYGKSTNIQTAGSAGIRLAMEPFNGLTELDNKVVEQVTSTALNGKWTKISGKLTMPANTTRVRISIGVASTVPNNETYYFDDVVVKEITEAQTALDLIDLNDELNQAMIQTGSNLIINGDFESGLFTQGSGVYTQEQKRSGERSLRINASGAKKEYFLLSEEGNQRFIPAAAGDVFYGEFYVYGKSTNAQTSGGSGGLILSFQPFNGNTELSNEVISQTASTALNGTWTQVFGKVIMPAGTTRVRISLVVSSNVSNNEIYYFDDVAVKEITAAQEAQDTADLAVQYGDDIVQSGSNLIVDPSFEKNWFAQAGSSFSTEQFRTGTRSLKITANGSLKTYVLLSDGVTPKTIGATEGGIFYAEVYVWGKTTNVQPPPGIAGIQIIFKPFNSLGVELNNQIISQVASTALNGKWTRVSGLVTMPENTKKVQVVIALTSGITSGENYYFDDVFVKDVTEANLAQQTIDTAINVIDESVNGGTATGKQVGTIKTNLQKAWANFWDGLNGTSGTSAKLPADVQSAAAAVKSTSGTALANAATANSNVQTVTDSVVQAVDGGTATGASHTTVKAKLQLAWANLWDGLTGNSSATSSSKLPSEVLTAGYSARAQANLGVTNAATASAAAATADGKAVVAQSLSTNLISSGPNLVVDSSFENTSYWKNSANAYSTDFARNGTRSLQITSTGTNYPNQNLFRSTTNELFVPCAPGDVYYVEAYVRASDSNTATTGQTYLQIAAKVGTSSSYTWSYINLGATAANTTPQTLKGGWTKLYGYGTIPANAFEFAATVNVHLNMPAGNVFYWDDAVCKEYTGTQNVIDNIAQAVDGTLNTGATVATTKTKLQLAWANFWDGLNGSTGTSSKLPSDVLTAGSAVRSQANLGVTNAGIADGKAVAAKGFAFNAIASGSNILPNPDFDNTTFALVGTLCAYSTDVAISGTTSLKLTGSGSAWSYSYLVTNETAKLFVPCAEGDVLYAECYVYGKATNVQTSGGAIGIRMGVTLHSATKVPTVNTDFVQITASTALNGMWTKISGYITIPANAYFYNPYVAITGSVPATEVYYVDQCVVREVTEANIAKTNAATADGKAVTAQSYVQTVTDGIVQAVDGGTATGATHTTVKTKLQLAWANLWDGLNGSSGNTSKLPSDIQTAAGTVRSTANTASANATTAIGAAATADAKAVTAKTLATTSLATGSNLIPNGGFENTGIALAGYGSAYSSDQKRSGSYSLAITATGTSNPFAYLAGNDTGAITLPGSAGDVLYLECYVYGKSTNVQTSGGTNAIWLAVDAYRTSGGLLTYTVNATASTALNGTWTKISGFVTLPANTNYFMPYIQVRSTVPAGEIYYFDDAACYRVTETQNMVDYINQAVDGGTATGAAHTTVKTKLQAAWSNFWDGLNGSSGSSGKLPSDVQTAAGSVRSTANTASTNASTAITNAAAADGKAVTAQNDLLLRARDFTNLVAGMDFESTNPVDTAVGIAVDTAQFHSGTKSLRIDSLAAGGTQIHPTYKATQMFECKAGEQFYIELWVKKSADYANTHASDPRFRLVRGNGANAGQTIEDINLVPAVIPTTSWTKLTLTVTVPSDATTCSQIYFVITGPQPGAMTGSLWIDDVIARRVVVPDAVSALPQSKVTGLSTDLSTNATNIQSTVDSIVQAVDGGSATGATPATTKTKLQLAWANLWDGLTGNNSSTSNSKLPSDVLTAGYAARAQANLGVTNAAVAAAAAETADAKAVTADGKAVTADGKAVTAQASVQTVTDSVVQAIDGGTATGATHGAVKTKLQLAWANLWDGLTGNNSSTSNSKLPSEVLTAGYNARAQANLGVSNASTAQTAATTAQSAIKTINNSGSNLVLNPSFETTSAYLSGNGSYSSEYARTGTYSLKMTANGTSNQANYLTTNGIDSFVRIPCAPADVYYVEAWVRGAPANTATTGSIYISGEFNTGTLASPSYTYVTFAASQPYAIGTASWYRLSGYYVAPANSVTFMPILVVGSNVAAGNVFYWDDVIVREVTHSAVTSAALYGSGVYVPTSTIQSGAVPAIDGSKINTGTLAEDRIASLSAGKISSGTFADARIPSLDTAKITSGTFGNARIGTDAIATANIQASAVTGAKTSGLDASKVTGGTLVETFIALLSRRKMRNTDFSNLMDDPGFENGTSGVYNGTYTIATPTGTAPDIVPLGGTKVLQLASAGSIIDVNLEPYGITVAPSETYYLEYYVRKTTTGTTGTVGVGTSMGLNGTTWVSYPSLYVLMSALSQNTWLKVSGIITVPAGANFMAVRASVRGDVPTGQTVQFDNILVRKATATELIADNAITSAKIGAAAVTSTAIATDAVGTNQIAANAVTGAEIAANAVGSTQIASSSVTNAKVATDAIATANIQASAVTGAKTSGLDAAKITSGQMAQAQVVDLVTNFSTTNGNHSTLVDNVSKSFYGDTSLSGTSLAEAYDAMQKLYADVAAATTRLNEIKSNSQSADTGGITVSVDFGNFASVAAAGFSESYTGSASNTIVISNGVAQFSVVNSSATDRKLIHNTPTSSDFQVVRGTMSAPPQVPSGTTPYFYALARVSPDGQSYVFARAYAQSLGVYKADIGYTTSGPAGEVIFSGQSGISLTWSLDMRFVAGVGSAARDYQIWSGNKVVRSFSESGTASRLCSNAAHTTPAMHDANCTKYRQWGAIAQVRNSRTSGKVSGCSASDNGTPSVNGSTARMYRGSTTVVSYASGSNSLPTSFFDSPSYETLNIDLDTAAGTFTVTQAKSYMVTARVKVNSTVAAWGALQLEVYDSSAGTWSVTQWGDSCSLGAGGMSLHGQWIQYLDVNDKVRVKTYRSTGTSNELVGGTDGSETYFSIVSAG